MQRLPAHGHFHSQLLDDEDAAAELLARVGEGDRRFGALGWTPERELLTTICDLLAQLHATLIQVNTTNGRRPDVTPLRRPSTALDRIQAKADREAHRERVRLFLPHQQ